MNSLFKELDEMSARGAHREILNRLISSRGRIFGPYSSDLNHAWYLVGDSFFCLGEINKSLKAFKRALAYDRGDFFSMMAIANCYSAMSKPRMALYYLSKAVVLNEKHDGIRYNLGNAYFDLNRYDEAIREYALVGKGSDVAKLARANSKKAVMMAKIVKKTESGSHTTV